MKKTIAMIMILALAVNIFLFATGRLSTLIFWLVIIICATVAYKVLPKTT